MERNELIASVAIDWIKKRIQDESEGVLRFCMFGFEPSLVRSIAQMVWDQNRTAVGGQIMVRVSTRFDEHRVLPCEVLSDESITHWRHYKLNQPYRAILFVADSEDLMVNDKSVEKISRLETDTLRNSYNDWLIRSGLTKTYVSESNFEELICAITAANETNVVRTIESFADFVLGIAGGILKERFVPSEAVERALPGINLPRYAGNFDGIPVGKRSNLNEWKKNFLRLQNTVPPFLNKEDSSGDDISERLKFNFSRHESKFSEEEKRIISKFLDLDIKSEAWVNSQKELLTLDWREISVIFDDISRQTAKSLGGQTLRHFEREFEGTLDETEIDLLKAAFPKDSNSELKEFFLLHRERIFEDRPLAGKWEKYIFGNSLEYTDFLIGLVETILRLKSRNTEVKDSNVMVTIRDSKKRSFWERKNTRIVRYFAFRYCGLREFFRSKNVHFEFGKLWEYFRLEDDDGPQENVSRSREANRIKFEVILDPANVDDRLQFEWKMPVDAVATSMRDDFEALANSSQTYGLPAKVNVLRQRTSVKGEKQDIDLADANSMLDVNRSENGSLVSFASDDNIFSMFKTGLDECSEFMDEEDISAIATVFEQFCSSYFSAIEQVTMVSGNGFMSPILVEQANVYGALLETLRRRANSDKGRQNLLRHVLSIGVVNVGGNSIAIVTPWHPLKLAEVSIKSNHVLDFIERVLQSDWDNIKSIDLLKDQQKSDLAANFYPEICVGENRDELFLLSVEAPVFDYCLANEPIQANESSNDSNSVSTIDSVASSFAEVGERFLDLLPHEQSNFSVVLYDAESKSLPSKFTKELSYKVEQTRELQCNLLLTHTDLTKARRVYEQLNATYQDDTGSIIASEAARNFLSRLRVGFIDENELTSASENREADLVALHNVISRVAKTAWKEAPDSHSNPPNFGSHIPSRWSRIRPIGKSDQTAVVYLACPTQPKIGQVYLNSVHSLIDGENARSTDVIPSLEVSFRDKHARRIIEQTHKMGEWVVFFDRILDHRLLKNNDVSVIWQNHDRQHNSRYVVSTTTNLRLLYIFLRNRLTKIVPKLVSEKKDQLLRKFIKEANDISGKITMRAAKHGRSANELLGVVLSTSILIRKLNGKSRIVGRYFLDEYYTWFGRGEGQIADIMVISPCMKSGTPFLEVVISESKFVNIDNYRSEAKKSSNQLYDTVAHLRRVLGSSVDRIDRELWLHRFADLMIEGIEQFNADELNGWDLYGWSDKVRQDKVKFEIIGFSHIFVHDDGSYDIDHSNNEIGESIDCFQHFFNKHQIRELIEEFFDPAPTHSDGQDESADSTIDGGLSMSSQLEPDTTSNGREESSDCPDDIQDRASQIESKPTNTDDVTLQTVSSSNVSNAGALDNSQSSRGSVRTQVKYTDPNDAINPEAEEWMTNVVTKLQRALGQFNMSSAVIEKRLTPNAVHIRIEGRKDMTVAGVRKIQQELLTTHSIKVINVLPDVGEVVVMIERPKREILGLQTLWEKSSLVEESNEQCSTRMVIGLSEFDGNPIFLDYETHAPHTLIAGETGSGKGVLLQTLLLDICYTNSPIAARIQMIDPKSGIDFPWLRRLPHLLGYLATTQEQAIECFENLVEEMERRYQLFAIQGANKLSKYNEMVDWDDQLPRIWLVHDELADWMISKDYREKVESSVIRLGNKARAAGIHLILVTQRPDKNAMSVRLRANLGNRLVLKMADAANSRLVLDEEGAEKLLGKGHLIARLSGEMTYAQAPYADDNEISDIVGQIRKKWV